MIAADWFSFAFTVVVALAIITLPGVAIIVAQGLAVHPRVHLLPLISIGLLSLAAVVIDIVGIRFTPIALGVCILVACAISYRRLRPPATPPALEPPRSECLRWWVLAATGVAGTVIALRILYIIGHPDNISQTFDNIFHLNAVRFILDSGNGSSLTLGKFVDESSASPYPAAWHDIVALIVQLSGSSIPIATNALAFVTGAIIWPVSVVALTRAMTGGGVLVSIAAAIVSAGMSQFPFLLLDFGVLYPTLLSTALLPAACAAAIQALRPEVARKGIFFGVGFAGLALAALGFSQPSSILAFIVIVFPWAVVAWTRKLRRVWRTGARQRAFALLATAASLGTILIVWVKLRPAEDAATWGPHESLAQAFGEVVSGSAMGSPLSPVVALGVFIGLVATVRRRFGNALCLASFAGVGFLYIMSSGMWFGRLRTFVVGGWYNDSNRVAALTAVVLVPLVAVGLEAAVVEARRYVERVWFMKRAPGMAFGRRHWPAAAALVSLGLLLTQMNTVQPEVETARESYIESAESPLLSSDEATLLKELPDRIPKDANVLGSPWTGASLVYAFTGHHTPLAHTFSVNADAEYALENLDSLDKEESVCRAFDRLRVSYVLDFGRREVHGGSHFPTVDPRTPPAELTVVLRVGSAVLYRVNGC